MTDTPISMQFSLNQAVLNTAIAAALPGLLRELQFNYTSGRAPKGLTADVTVTEAMIRKAVENYARRTVAATFTHFNIEFQATRGEDGITANITASNAPIASEGDDAPTKAPTPAPVSEPAAEPTTTKAVETADVVEDAPFAEDGAEAAPEPAEAAEPATTTAAPAAGRSRLFGDLKRPDNSAAAE